MSSGGTARRRTVLGGAGVLGAAVACGGLWAALPGGDSGDGGAVRTAEPAERASFLYLVAHPDDDLYFINPQIQQAARRTGTEIAVVVATAGEADGVNRPLDAPGREHAPVDPAGYSGARRRGHRAAYALMLTGRADAVWRTTAVELDGGLLAEHCVLPERPEVALYYLGLRKGQGETGLRELWTGALRVQQTLPVPGSPVTAVQRIGREQLLDALADLMDRHRPSCVGTLDPDPEHDPGKPGLVSTDHRDHTAVAQFALAAVERHRDRTGRHPVVDHYRGYANHLWPPNLAPADVADKTALIEVYARADRQLGPHPERSYRLRTAKLRHEPGTDWLLAGADGRSSLFAVLAGRVWEWRQARPGAAWTGPAVLDEGRGAAWMLPALTTAAAPDGTAHLAALRRTALPAGGVELEVVHAARAPGAASFGPWTPLGGPDAGARQRRETGVPAAAVDGAGQLLLFVRDFAQGLSMRVRSAAGVWGPWTSLAGPTGDPVQDAPTAVCGPDGRVTVLAPTRTGVRAWQQTAPGGPPAPVAAPWTGDVPSGRVAALAVGDGALVLAFREAGTARVRLLHGAAPTTVGSADGVGPVALSGPSEVWRLERDLAPAVSGATPPAGAAAALRAVAATARMTAALGADGHPRLSLRRSNGSWSAWQRP